MEEKQKEKLVEEIMKDTLIYITIFGKELAHIDERNFIKTFFTLILIEQYDNPSISSLGKILNVSKSQMTSKTDELAKAGLVERIPDKKDRRIIRIVLTPKGQYLINNSQKAVKDGMNQLLSPLSLKEVEELKKSMETIKNVVLKIQDGQKKN